VNAVTVNAVNAVNGLANATALVPFVTSIAITAGRVISAQVGSLIKKSLSFSGLGGSLRSTTQRWFDSRRVFPLRKFGEESFGGVGDCENGPVHRGLRSRRNRTQGADFAHVLERRGLNFGTGRARFESPEGRDVSTHTHQFHVLDGELWRAAGRRNRCGQGPPPNLTTAGRRV
jgi:hypothetical protein